jgi:squalene-hopene/tetraprenyl-beta-curcumene cyclase
MTRANLWNLPALCLAALLLSLGLFSGTSAQQIGPAEKEWAQLVDKGINFLRTQQDVDGSFSKGRSLGITGVVATGLLQTGRVGPDDPMVNKALQFLLTLVNQKEGHLAGKDPKVQLKNYVTAVNVMALAASKDPRYRKIVDDAAHFLKQLQWDEGEGKLRDSDYFGGAGYDSQSRPDMSNTQFFSDALRAAGVPQDDKAFQNVLVFVSRSQNLKSEHNDQPWAGKVNDGGFIYTAAGGGESKAGGDAQTGFTSYGSMTYAGLKSLIYAGVDRNDKRVKAAWEWIQKNYTVDENPGMPKGRGQLGLYYYYHTMAKCLDAMGEDYIVDAKGVKHDWRKELTQKLASLQRPDGSWVNEADRWFEGDANLVTGYALMTLSYCKPKK